MTKQIQGNAGGEAKITLPADFINARLETSSSCGGILPCWSGCSTHPKQSDTQITSEQNKPNPMTQNEERVNPRISEIVEENNDWILKTVFAKTGEDTEKVVEAYITWLTTTLEAFEKEVREEERELKFGTWEWLESQAGYQQIQELLNSDETTKETTKVALRDLIANYQKEELKLKGKNDQSK